MQIFLALQLCIFSRPTPISPDDLSIENRLKEPINKKYLIRNKSELIGILDYILEL